MRSGARRRKQDGAVLVGRGDSDVDFRALNGQDTAALVRVATPLGILDYSNGMQMAALMWAGAFVLFLIAYGPILFRPSLGQT